MHLYIYKFNFLCFFILVDLMFVYIIVLISFFIALLWSISSLIAKKIDVLFGYNKTALILLFMNLIVTIPFMFLFAISINSTMLIFSIISGLLDGISYLLFFNSLQTEQTSNTYTLLTLQAIVLIIFGLFVLGENVITYSIIGIIFILFGIFAVSNKELSLKFNRRLIPAIIGNITWALSWIAFFYAYKASNNFIDPLVFSYTTAVLLIGLKLWLRSSKINSVNKESIKTNKILKLGIILSLPAGFATAIGNILFAYFQSINVIAIAATISNISPILIAIMAYFIYKDKLTKLNIIGILLAVLGTIIIAL